MDFQTAKRAFNDLKTTVEAEKEVEFNLIKFIDDINPFFKSVSIDKEKVFRQSFRNDENEKIEYISSIDDWNDLMLDIYRYIMNIIRKYFDEISSKIIEDSLDLCCEMLNYEIIKSEEVINESFSIISKMLQKRTTFATPYCFKLIGCICAENTMAQQYIMNSNLLFEFINEFKYFFKTDNSSDSNDTSTQEALKTIQKLSSKKEGFLTILSTSNVHTMLLSYISSHINQDNDFLFAGCVNLLENILINDKVSSSIANEYFFDVALKVLTNSNQNDNWKSMNHLVEVILMKYPEFGFTCVKNNFFVSILEFLSPSRLADSLTEKEQLLLNLLVLMTLSLSSCKYLLEKKFDNKICEYVKNANNSFTASMFLILGNFCFNDLMATKLIEEDQLDLLIIDSLIKIFDSNILIDDYCISYLSILKNLAIPIQNRIKIFKRSRFIEIIERICLCSHSVVLQKLFILLRVICSKSESEISKTIVENDIIMKSVFENTKDNERNVLCRPNALSLLLTLITKAKSSFTNFDFINDIFLKEISKNINPGFLLTIYTEPESNEILFSVFKDEQIKCLENYNFFNELHDIIVVPPYRSLIVRNAISAFRRLIKTYGNAFNKGVKNIDDRLISAASSLENNPQLINKEDLKKIIHEFKEAKEK